MHLRVAIQMDSMDSIDITKDSTFALATEAQARGYELFHYEPKNLIFNEGIIIAKGQRLTIEKGDTVYSLCNYQMKKIDNFDVLLLRQDPPFDMSYITTTHMLEMVSSKVLVVNNPFWVRNHPEKILALDFNDLIPPTAIGRDIKMLSEFRSKHKDVIVKPLYGNGGAGVFLVRQDDMNFNSLCEMFFQSSREPIIIQRYLPDVRAGDKRIILVDGKPIGALNRIPMDNEVRSNLHVGGKAEKVALTQRDLEICDRIGPLLLEHGQIFVGIDVIGEYLTEINLTSPTGLAELTLFNEINASGLVWDAIEQRIE